MSQRPNLLLYLHLALGRLLPHRNYNNCYFEAEQLLNLFRRVDMTEDVFQYRTFTRLKQLEYLIRTHQIDDNFFWTK